MSLVETARRGPVLTITLADAEHRNVLSAPMLEELHGALDLAEASPDVRVVILTNAGHVFCAGADLATAAAPGGAPRDLTEVLRRLQDLAAPVVGRIAGHCVAGGVGLAAACDLAVATSGATFGFTEVRLGLVPAMIAVVCLPKMRPADARAMMLRGGRFDAAEAARLGLITATAEPEDLDGAIAAIVADLLAGEPGALALTKRLVRELPALDRETAFARAAEISAARFASEAAREGIAAYREKRPASWVPPAAP